MATDRWCTVAESIVALAAVVALYALGVPLWLAVLVAVGVVFGLEVLLDR
jgi:hypothetical protein